MTTQMRSRNASLFLFALNTCPFGFVGVREDRAVERDRPQRFGADIVAFLRRGQQRMQDLDRRLEHFDEFQKTLVGAAETAREGIGVRIVLAEMLELPDVHLADEGGDILVVLVAGLGLGDRDTGAAWRDRACATSNLEMSPPNSSSRFTAHGLITPPTRWRSMPYLSSERRFPRSANGTGRAAISNTGLIVSPAFST